MPLKSVCFSIGLAGSIIAAVLLLLPVPGAAEPLFKDRSIFLSNDDNQVFRIGITGTTAGYNFYALVAGAKQEAISLGTLGYWEKVSDPPSFLRNFDLQVIVKNSYTGNFVIEFEYDPKARNIQYRILEGPVLVKVDHGEYYPELVIGPAAAPVVAEPEPVREIKKASKRFLFFDFNSFDADLRMYYGKVKRLLDHPDYRAYFYYYESTNYNDYYFRTYQDTGKLDIQKMGLSLENGTLEYYQKVMDNLMSRHGPDFTDQIILVTRFGKPFARELKKYAQDIGVSNTMVVTVWSYEEVE